MTTSHPHQPPHSVHTWDRCRWYLVLLVCLGWMIACACDLKGFECRNARDCGTQRVCQHGWCVTSEQSFAASDGGDAREEREEPEEKAAPVERTSGGDLSCQAISKQSLGKLTLMSGGHGDLGQIVSDGQHIYATDRKQGLVLRQAVNQSTFAVLQDKLPNVYGIVVDDRYVYVGLDQGGERGGAIVRFSKSERGNITFLAKDLVKPKLLVQDETFLYWNAVGSPEQWDGGRIQKITKAGGTPVTLASPYRPFSLALDSSYLYWITSHAVGAIQRVSLHDHAVSTVHTGVSFGKDLAVDRDHLYFLTDAVRRVPKQGGRVQKLSPLLSDASQILLEQQYAYVATGTQVLVIPTQCPGPTSTYAIQQGSVESIASDPQYLYLLVSSDGVATNTIYKMQKIK